MSGAVQSALIKLGLRSEPTSSTASVVALLFLALVGSWTLFSAVFRLLRVLADVLLVTKGKSLSKYGSNSKSRSDASWALITGATDGIGKEYALQLAKAGFNVVLASRTAEKLGAVAGEIESAYPGIKTRTQAIDFSANDEKAYAALKSIVEGLNIGILVNNVGLSHSMPVTFWETPEKEQDDIIEVNIKAQLRVTRMVVPGMIERRRGLILNMGSFAGAAPTPLLATYSGSKAFLATWSTALAAELAPHKIDVSLINAYFVVSAMSKIRKPSLVIPTPRDYVRQVLKTIGRAGGALGRQPAVNTPWPAHALIDWAMTNLLSKQWLLNYTYKQQVGIRKRALRKAERASKSQ